MKPTPDYLDRIEENARFHVDPVSAHVFATGEALFRRYSQFSLVDACIVASMQTADIDYLYSFDDDFDAAEDVTRFETASNPYNPE